MGRKSEKSRKVQPLPFFLECRELHKFGDNAIILIPCISNRDNWCWIWITSDDVVATTLFLALTAADACTQSSSISRKCWFSRNWCFGRWIIILLKEPGAGVKTLWSGQTWDDAWVEKLKTNDCCWEFWGALDNWHCLSLKLSLKVKVGDFVDEGGHQDVEVAAWCRPLSPKLPCAWQHPRSLIILI